MPVTTAARADRAGRALETYPVSLQHAAQALWDGDFWGREPINPEPPLRERGKGKSR